MAASQTVAMNQKTQELQAKGIDVINMSVGQPDFPTPDHIKQAGKDAIDHNFTYYSPVEGYKELLEAVSQKMKRENGLTYAPDQIVISNGAKHALANVLLCLLDEGDEAIIPAPYWVSYVEQVKIAGAKNVVINGSMENKFKVTPSQIEQAITPKTKVLMLCSPSNPTGAFYSKKELKDIVDVVKPHENIFVVTDEIYEYINFVGPHQSIAQFEELKERVVVINGVSKGFAMTGWRIGYMCGPQWLANACKKLQGQITTGPSSISQQAAIAALNGDKIFSQDMQKAFLRRRNLVMKKLDEIPGISYVVPEAAFYIFPNVSFYFGKQTEGIQINNSKDLCMYLLEHAHVGTVPGEAFGDPNCIRISYANADDQLEKGLFKIKQALEKLK
jgi:aspartate aminotransferase